MDEMGRIGNRLQNDLGTVNGTAARRIARRQRLASTALLTRFFVLVPVLGTSRLFEQLLVLVLGH